MVRTKKGMTADARTYGAERQLVYANKTSGKVYLWH